MFNKFYYLPVLYISCPPLCLINPPRSFILYILKIYINVGSGSNFNPAVEARGNSAILRIEAANVQDGAAAR